MRKPSKFDVYSIGNFIVPKSRSINGNLYVKGDILFKNIARLEVFGDVIVDGNILDGSMIIHGNLTCNELCNLNVEVDENIYITEDANFLTLKSNFGHISIGGSAYGISLRAEGGSIKVGETTDLTYIYAFDDISISEYVIAKKIKAGAGLNIGGSIIKSFNDGKLNVSIYNGGLHSKNLNID